jgi:hypothetical protein
VVLVNIGLSVLQVGTLVRVAEQGCARGAQVQRDSPDRRRGAEPRDGLTGHPSSLQARLALETATTAEVRERPCRPTHNAIAANDPAQVGKTLPRGET